MKRNIEEENNDIELSEEEIARAAKIVSEALANAVEEDKEHVFSKKFTDNMEALIRKDRARRTARRFAQSAAAILLLLCIGSGVLIASDTAAGADFKRWLLRNYEHGATYDFQGDNEAGAITGVEFKWLPEGCRQDRSELGEDSGYSVIVDSEGNDAIIFCYAFMDNGSAIYVSDSNSVYEKAEVNGKTADFYLDANDGDNALVWIDEMKGIQFDLSAHLEKSVLEKVAENIVISLG